jgi:hypothetical protein
VALIFYTLKNQEKRNLQRRERESKYQEIIENLTYKFNLVKYVKRDVIEIKDFVSRQNP